MPKYKTVSTIVVDCSDWGFGPFEIRVTPCEEETKKHDKPWYEFTLHHPRYGVVMWLFACGAESEQDAAELAYYNAPEYIPDYIEEVSIDD